MKQNELQNDVTENNEQISGLTDLEPVVEVKGGVTKASGSIYTVTFGGAITTSQNSSAVVSLGKLGRVE